MTTREHPTDGPDGAPEQPTYIRRRGLYLPTGTGDADALRAQLAADRNLTAINREHQWVSLAADSQHEIRLADVAEYADRAKRSRRQRAKDVAETAKLADLYRSAKSAGARARVRAEMYASAEMRALRIATMRKVTLVAGLPVLAAFAAWSTTGVQAGVVKLLGLERGDPSWWSAWGVEPALIAVVALIIIGRAGLRSSGGDTDWRADVAEGTALSVSIALNILGGWTGGWAALAGAVAHSLGPIGAAGTAFLIGLFDSYLAQAKPWDGAQRLADLGFDDTPDAHPLQDDARLQIPPVSQLDYTPQRAQVERPAERSTRGNPPIKARQKSPKTRATAAAKPPATSGYAPAEGDPGVLAAQAVISGDVESIRKAAQEYGVSEGTVRNRIKAMQSGTAQAAIPTTPIQAPNASVTAGVNGHRPTFTKES
jgi:hypothetical protein